MTITDTDTTACAIDPMEASMREHHRIDTRMRCLEAALHHNSPKGDILETAQRYLDFVLGTGGSSRD